MLNKIKQIQNKKAKAMFITGILLGITLSVVGVNKVSAISSTGWTVSGQNTYFDGDSTGKVSIGISTTSTPAAKFHLYEPNPVGDAAWSSQEIAYLGGKAGIGANTDVWLREALIRPYEGTDPSTTALVLQRRSSIGSGTYLSFWGDKIGLDKIDPTAKLDIHSTGGINTLTDVQNGSAILKIKGDGAAGLLFDVNKIEQMDSQYNAININSISSANTNISAGGGKVGIGWSFPSEKLEVGNGGNLSLRAASGSSNSGDILFKDGNGTTKAKITHDDGSICIGNCP